MRIGVISDIHGNWSAMETALSFIDKQGVDRIVCLGDAIDPLPDSRAVVEHLENRKIPILRGNHEDYVVAASESLEEPFATSPNWEPVRVLARSLDRQFIDKVKNLPLTLTVNEGQPNEVTFFHASPNNNQIGWRNNIDEKLEAELASHPASTLVCGHWHMPESRKWKTKNLVTSGSIGIPLRGSIVAEFLVMESRDSEWLIEHFELPYDNRPTLASYRDSGWVAEGGPLAWMIYDEVRTAHRRILPFNQWLKGRGITQPTMAELKDAGRLFLKELGTWHELAAFT